MHYGITWLYYILP